MAVIYSQMAGWSDWICNFKDWNALQSSAGVQMPAPLRHTTWEVLTILAGTLIVVQGFETPRYLGDQFDAATRIKASRWSQIISTTVYVALSAAVRLR